jgi:ribulose-5-phosphate 4-epimerase/fuculose-1-phosphate aldolase
MREQIAKYLAKLMRHGLVENPGDVSLFGLDDEIYTNEKAVPENVRSLFGLLNINSLIIARPAPLFRDIIGLLGRHEPEFICPCDCESLTFIHDIPVVEDTGAGPVARALNRRKGCIAGGDRIVTTGTVSLEQAFISLSSILFATFVKFFTDAANGLHGFGPPVPGAMLEALPGLLARAEPSRSARLLRTDAPRGENEILEAMDETGKAVVEARLVDSFFGNISFRDADVIYISQTGSSLDELPGYIDRVPLDGSSTCGITSSSELLAHVKTYELTQDTAILHGHPRFSVIMSMLGGPLEFGSERSAGGVPVVAGEVGAGARGLMHTLPGAMQASHGAIVSGHGTFTSCTGSFAEAFRRLMDIEALCYDGYREAVLKRLG